MYVMSTLRRNGVARNLPAHLERAAAGLKFNMLRLEAGNRRHAALKLYESCGFVRSLGCGDYLKDATRVCYERHIGTR
jgi:putative acetyltransferase